MKLAIISTHPIQYYAPLFCLMAKKGNITLKVFYTWERGSESYDKGFGKKVEWDIPLLEGYDYTFVSNNGNLNRDFWALKNPTLNIEIETWGATALLVFGWNYYSHLNAMRYFKGKIPVLFRGDSHLLDFHSPIKRQLRKLLLTWVYKHIDYALYVGTNNRNYYLSNGLKEHQLIFAPHAIDNERFFDSDDKKYEEQALAWRKKLGYTEEDIVFTFIGKFEEKKNPIFLLEAFQKLNYSNIRLLMIGNGLLQDELKVCATDDDRIQFLEFQNQQMMPIIYRIGNVFVLPSKGPQETWGLAVNEAMACSRPVLVSDKVGCAADLVKKGDNGYIFKSDDKDSLYKALRKYINKSRNEIAEEGMQAYKLVQNYSFEAISKAVEVLLDRL